MPPNASAVRKHLRLPVLVPSFMSPADAPLTPFMRALLYAASALVTGVGLPLLLAPTYTDVYFPFPIDPPLTAAFLGACYVAAGVVEFLAARSNRWGAARIAVPGVMAFTVLTAVTSWRSLERFSGPTAVVWIWIAVYSITPFTLGAAWWLQRRAAEHHTHPAAPATQLPLSGRTFFLVFCVLLSAMGAWMRLAPEAAGRWWPWPLSSPTSYAGPGTMEPYAGAWMLGLSLVALGVAESGRRDHARPALIGALVLSALFMIAILRDMQTIHWNAAPAVLMLAAIVSLAGISVFSLRKPTSPPTT